MQVEDWLVLCDVLWLGEGVFLCTITKTPQTFSVMAIPKSPFYLFYLYSPESAATRWGDIELPRSCVQPGHLSVTEF